MMQETPHWIRAVARWRAERRVPRTLQSLDNRVLKDIGIDRPRAAGMALGAWDRGGPVI